MWNSASAMKSLPASAILMAGSVMFQTHMVSATFPSSYDVFHDQDSSNYDNGRWHSVNLYGQQRSEEPTLVGIADIISFVKMSLGLPNKDIAAIFGVTRQTLHSYVTDAGTTQSIKPSTRERVITLYEVIKEVTLMFSHSPGAMSKNYMIAGCSLLDLLIAEKLDITKILQHSKLLAEKMDKIPSSSSKDDSTLHSLTRSV